MTEEITKVAVDSARGSFFLMSGSAIATVIMAIQAIVITNLLGPELYGQYTLALLIPQVIYLVTDLGLGYGVTRFAAVYKVEGQNDRLSRLIKRTLMIKFAIGLLFFIFGFFFAGWFASLLQRPLLAFYIQIASLLILFQAVYSVIASTFVGLDKAEHAAILGVVLAAVNTVISIGLVATGFGIAGSIIGSVAGYIAAATASALVLFVILRRIPKANGVNTSSADLRTMMAYSAPLYVSLLLAGFISYYQFFILAHFAVDVDIGNYKAALNFAALIAIVSGPLTAILLPAFSKLESSTEDKIRSFFKIANKYSAFLVAPIAFFIIIFSNQIVDVIYQGKYTSAAGFLSLYSLVYLLAGFGYITLTSFYNGMSDTKTTLVMGAIAFVVLLTLSPTLASIVGVQGVIIASVLASAASTIFGAVRARRRFRVDFGLLSVTKIYAIAALSCVPSFLILRFVHFPRIPILGPNLIGILVAGVLFVLAYATLAPLTKIMTIDELQKAAMVTGRTKSLSFIAGPLLKYEQRILRWRVAPSPLRSQNETVHD